MNKTEYWALKSPCVFFEQGISLMNIKCPKCNHVFGACAEAGCVIPDLMKINKMAE